MANDVKNISPMKLTLLVTIVPRDKEGFYIDYLQTLGSNLQMSASGHGTANKEVLEYLGSHLEHRALWMYLLSSLFAGLS